MEISLYTFDMRRFWSLGGRGTIRSLKIIPRSLLQ